ncbi:hypothetical protein N780_18355 [Pontibacillus chungwhensis BH030062]|uniref:Uncharacterized protein n=1 Tax=Pontibacillus chungwhensis BH030062 TaxID=1385513 RepID=A0A0A2UYZ2_9BACI|nr:hypothetical protein N780_18355 [Pontibacillus chungwhensis BH030062]
MFIVYFHLIHISPLIWKARGCSAKRAVTFMSAWACSGTTRFPAGSWEASSFAFALCGVFPRLLIPRESRSPRASPGHKDMNGSPVYIRRSGASIYGMFSFTLIWQRWDWKLRDSRGQKSLGETPEAGVPGEEAHQLPTGKRVVSSPTLHSIKANGNILSNSSLQDYYPHLKQACYKG